MILSSLPAGFVSAPTGRDTPLALRAAAGLPLATVSGIDGFVEAGRTIGLVDAGQRVQFEVNRSSAQRADVKVGSQLRRHARSARGRVR